MIWNVPLTTPSKVLDNVGRMTTKIRTLSFTKDFAYMILGLVILLNTIFFPKHSFNFVFTSTLLEESDKSHSDLISLKVFFRYAIEDTSTISFTSSRYCFPRFFSSMPRKRLCDMLYLLVIIFWFSEVNVSLLVLSMYLALLLICSFLSS